MPAANWPDHDSFDETAARTDPAPAPVCAVADRHASNADDLVQTCLERALGSVANLPEGDLRAKLFTILYRQFVDQHRRSRRYARMLGFYRPR